MLMAFIRFGDGKIVTDAQPATLTAALRDPGAVFWLDICKPTEDEYANLDDVFGFHPLAIEDTMVYSQRPKIESYDHIGDANRLGYFFMVIHGPDLSQFKENLRTRELDMFVSKSYLVTVHEEPIKSIDSLATRAKADPRVVLDIGIDRLLHSILDHLVDNYMPIFDYFQDALDELEERATHEPTQGLLREIAAKKKDLLNLRRVIGPQRDVLAQLTRGEVPFIREGTRVYLRDVLDHLNRSVETIELYRDLVMGCRDVYMASVNNQLNQIMKTLTIMSVVALPLTVITSFFGMNFPEAVPWLFRFNIFLIAMGIMLGLPVALLWIFRKKKWM